MRESVQLTGVVISAAPVGEYDRRLVILSGERGRITAFAHGVRRGKSPLTAAAGPMVFAKFTLYEGRDAYTLAGAEVIDYFTDLACMLPESLYAQYFLEFAVYFAREGIESRGTVNLIFAALKSLMKGSMSPELIRAVFEIRILAINGEYAPPSEGGSMDDASVRAAYHASSAGIAKLFGFDLPPESEKALIKHASRSVAMSVDHKFKSLEVIDKMK